MGWSLLFQDLLFNCKMTKAPPFCTFQNMQTSNFPCRNITLSMVTVQYFEAKTTTGLCTQDAQIRIFWLHCITSHILFFTVNLTIKMSQIHFKHCSQDMKANSQHAAGCDSFSPGAEKGPSLSQFPLSSAFWSTNRNPPGDKQASQSLVCIGGEGCTFQN